MPSSNNCWMQCDGNNLRIGAGGISLDKDLHVQLGDACETFGSASIGEERAELVRLEVLGLGS